MKERHGLLKVQLTQLSWIPETDSRTWINNEMTYRQRPFATKSILKIQNVFKNPQWKTHSHKGFLWTAEFSGVAILPDRGESQHLLGAHQKDYQLCQEMDGNTGGCALRRYVQLLNSLEEWAPARHWLELLNKANFSCQRKENLQRAEEIINSLVNISGADRDLGEDKKVNMMK